MQVPVSDGNQVREAPLQGGIQDVNQYLGDARTLAQAGEALTSVGATTDRIVQREAQRSAYEAQSAIQAKFLDYQQQYQSQRQGDKAKGLTNDVDKWWSDAAAEAGKQLDPMSRALVSRQLTQARAQALAGAGHFENMHLEAATDASWNAAKVTTTSAAAAAPFVQVPGKDADGNPTMLTGVDSAIGDLHAKNAEYVQRKGLTDPAVLEALNLKDTTLLHTQVLQGLERNDPDAARAYFAKYKTEIDGTQHAEISHQIDTVGNAAKAQAIGAQLAQQFSYTQTAEAQKAIDALPGSPELHTAIRAELEHRHAVQQSDADKGQALSVSKVAEMLYSGSSKAAILASPVYQGLRDKGAALKMIEDKNYSDLLRANATDAHAIAALTRHETELHITQASNAFAYSDPTVLAGMPREKIAMLLPTLGRDWTEQLLAKKDSFTKSETKLRDAKMDQDDFNSVADTMGLHPLKATSESDKRDLMVVKSRTEQLIDAWQAKNGREMPREEKRTLMQKELATQVTVGGMLWNTDTNVLQVAPGDVKNLVVPEIDRGQIITRLRQVKRDPAYTPTPDEIGAYYLNKKQRDAAGLHAK